MKKKHSVSGRITGKAKSCIGRYGIGTVQQKVPPDSGYQYGYSVGIFRVVTVTKMWIDRYGTVHLNKLLYWVR